MMVPPVVRRLASTRSSAARSSEQLRRSPARHKRRGVYSVGSARGNQQMWYLNQPEMGFIVDDMVGLVY